MQTFRSPVEHGPLTITQPFRPGIHPGVDLRNADGEFVCLPEEAVFLRSSETRGLDGYGNTYTVWQGVKSGMVLKFIHTSPGLVPDPAQQPAGYVVGFTDVKGNSQGAHLHFETWDGKYSVDPVEHYFKAYNIPFVYK